MTTHIIIAAVGIFLGYYIRWFVVWLRLRRLEKVIIKAGNELIPFADDVYKTDPLIERTK